MGSNGRDTGERRPDPALRDDLVARFSAWLDEVLSDERPPEGLPAELLAEIAGNDAGPADAEEPDLHHLWSAMTSLAQEVKLQGRAFDRLGDSLEGPRSQREIAAETKQRARRDALEYQLDLRDRLLRGLTTSRDHLDRARRGVGSSWLMYLFGKPVAELLQTIEALEEGYLLTLERVDQRLADDGVSEIECVGRPFDARRMLAVAIERREDHEAGEVLEVLRRGYRRGDELIRCAEVRVARWPDGDGEEGRSNGRLPEPKSGA